MVNFKKLRKLIIDYERLKKEEQEGFFQRLHDIAEIELNLRQSILEEYFGVV